MFKCSVRDITVSLGCLGTAECDEDTSGHPGGPGIGGVGLGGLGGPEVEIKRRRAGVRGAGEGGDPKC